jgi:hypothetical protein
MPLMGVGGGGGIGPCAGACDGASSAAAVNGEQASSKASVRQ